MKEIILFQPYLRAHILNFGKATKNFRFVIESKRAVSSKDFYKKSMSSPEKEFSRSKVGLKNTIRRLLGILNLRMKFTRKGDLLFTYGCLLLTNKPYCTYIENGVALFNYDPIILRNPIAQLLFSAAIRLPQCKRLIFMSEIARQSLLATGKFSKSTRRVIEKKSSQIYPFVTDPESVTPKIYSGSIKLLFTGIYYVKGGRELVNAFERIRKDFQNVSLTIVTPFHMLLESDKQRANSVPGITLLDAALDQKEMENLYRTHDIFVFPTFRDTFGLVLIEAISFGLPIIATDQYAVTEMAVPNYNALIFPKHPLMDYDPITKEMYGKLYNAKALYDALFAAEREGKMAALESFIYESIEKFLHDPGLLNKYSRASLELYKSKFSENRISNQIEGVFLESLK